MVVSGVCGDMGGDSSNYLWRLRHNTARPDIVGADQPQPVDALFVGQVRCTWRSSVHAAPAGSMDQPEGVGKGVFSPSFRDAPSGAGPESILPIVVMDSGFARFARAPE